MNVAAGSLRALALAVLCGAGAAQEHAPPREEKDLPAAAQPRGRALVSISREETRSGPRWSVLCERAPLDELVRALAKKASLALEGAELLPPGATVTIELERRTLEQVLAIVLGTQGLRHELARGALRLLPPTNDPAELLRLAQDAW